MRQGLNVNSVKKVSLQRNQIIFKAYSRVGSVIGRCVYLYELVAVQEQNVLLRIMNVIKTV